MLWWRTGRQPTAYDDDWEDLPSQGGFYKWGLGVALPLVIFGYGLCAIFLRRADYGSDVDTLTLHGANAVAYGVAALSLSLFLHCHYFWGNIYDGAWFDVLGKILSGIGFIIGISVIIFRVGLWGVN